MRSRTGNSSRTERAHRALALTWLAALLLACAQSPRAVVGTETPSATQRETRTLMHQGHARSYIVHVPRHAVGAARMPVLLMLHGGGGTGRAALRETGWVDKADQAGFIAVFPNALARDPLQRSSFGANPQLWNDGSNRFYPGQNAADDVGFIAAILDALAADQAVDAGRVYVTGFSNGASMSFRVGAELAPRIAAIAPVAGALWVDPARLSMPVPMLYITGTADPLNLIDGGVPRLASGGSDRVRAKPKPPVRDSVLKWGAAVGCAVLQTDAINTPGVHSETCTDGQGGATVRYIAIDGLGHVWPGGRSLLPEAMVGSSVSPVQANDLIWAFFMQHMRSPSSR